MNFAGYWFYGGGAITGEEMAAYYVSYGLLGDAPAYTPPTGISGIERWIPRIPLWPNFGRRR